METKEILEKVKTGELSVEEAEQFFKKSAFEELGYAKLDTNREIRSGFQEVIYCQGKADDHLVGILRDEFPELEYDPLSHIIKIEKEKEHKGKIVVCSAGTADLNVAEEAAQTAEFFGCHVERLYDVGVSGIHRLLSQLDILQSARCIIAVAGMEGALASVIGGLVDCPVIAVPTSVGYGASFHGVSALLTMINSCANGIAVVNIDNGYGAGYIATQINRTGETK